MALATQQLTLDVAPHPALDPDDAAIVGTLKLTGDLAITVDLNPGDQLLVTVADDGSGEVLSRATFEVTGVAFKPIRDKDAGMIGTDRVHQAKVTDE